MKQLVIVCLIAVFASCSSSQDEARLKEEKVKEDNIAIVNKYIQAVQNKDSKTMEDLLSEDYIGFGPSYNDSINKSQAVASWKDLADNFYEKIEYVKSVNIASHVNDAYRPGDFVSNWAHVIIKYKDGRGPINILANTSYRIENGKITLSRTIYNEADAMRQLGYEMVKSAQ